MKKIVYLFGPPVIMLIFIIYLISYLQLRQLSLKHIRTSLKVSNIQSEINIHPEEPAAVTRVNTSLPFRGLIESNRLKKLCMDMNKTIKSDTTPPFYPYEGIGKTVVILDNEYKTSHFRHYCGSNLAAIVTVYSAAQNFERRTAIRDTIGKQCQLYSCKLVFICGMSEDMAVIDKLKIEYNEEKDIFMKNKMDTYANLNDKVVAMLDWLLEFCPEPKHVIHHIDDTFVNVKTYLQCLEKQTDQRYVYGQVISNFRPIRIPNDKYYVSPEIYPGNTYPDFVVGASYAFTNSLTRELRCAVHRAKYIWLEDVWLGEIKDYLGFKLVQRECESWNTGPGIVNIKKIPDMCFLHPVDVEEFYRFNDALGAGI